MTHQSGIPAELAHNGEIAKELEQLGITCIPVDNFYYREYHYTNLKDAVAQSTRDKIRVGLRPAT
jgi:hypothetical protein